MVNQAQIPLEKLIPAIAQMGYAAVECWRPDETFNELVSLAHRHGLVVSMISGHDSLGVGLNDPAQHERIEGELAQSIDLAVQHGIPGVICFSGNVRRGQSDADAIAQTARGLKRCALYAEKKGINLNMELLNTIVDHPGYQCNHTAWGVAVCQQVNSPRVKLLYDIYHMQIMEGNIVQTISQNIQWIGHFHTAGVPGRTDIDGTQEINYRFVAQAIADLGFTGYISHEFRPLPGHNPLDCIREAFEIIDV
jgi:hydroxypyruvate isomerase